MLPIPSHETRRLFGTSNRPEFNTNVRHRAILRKALELYTPEQLGEVFHQNPTRLRVAMGSASTFSQLGKIKTNFVRNYRLVSYETTPPDLEAREALRAYRDVYDAYFMSRGNDYAIRNAAVKPALQAGEQTWHNWIGPYRAARGMPDRPNWALQALPGLQRVRVAPLAPAPAPAPTPRAQRCQARFPTLPTPPPSSPVRSPAPVRIDLSHIDDAPAPTPRAQRRRARFPTLPTPPPSSPATVRMDLSHIDDEPARPAWKRTFLGVIDISDDEEEMRPRKKAKFLGHIDIE
ncbi:hypothetical protein B0H14DRAFT_2576282 [Mycena olivaceomarginata]|nr:hypothetical protein B0H14DRAFT_2576282 [Mycena olivaceomarginata]